MNFFSNIEIDGILQAETIQFAGLIYADFLSQPMRVWDGAGTLMTEDNHQWLGLGTFLQVSDLSRSMDGAADQSEFSLSGVDTQIVQLAKNAAAEISNRSIKVYGQVLDEEKPVGNYFQLWAGTMDQVRFRGQGAQKRTVSITAEGLFVRRRRPVRARFSDRDQQARYPGDRGLELVASLANKEVTWPNY